MNFMQLIIVILKIYNYQKSLMGQESSLRVKEVDHMEPKVATLSLSRMMLGFYESYLRSTISIRDGN